MSERTSSSDPKFRTDAALAAVTPWLQTLAELKPWLNQRAGTLWPDGGKRRAADVLALLRDTLGGLARGEEAIPCAYLLPRSAADPRRIDTLLAAARRAAPAPPARLAEQRRKAVLDLGLWDALRRLCQGPHGPSRPPTAAQLHAWLALPTPPATCVSPAPAYAASGAAREFFDVSVRRVLEALARRVDAGGGAPAYASAIPSEPFDGGLPSLVAWSHAWSVAVAGVYLDLLHRHAGEDMAQALLGLWSGRLDAVRFRAGAGLTALPTRDGALHLDLWTCVVKAQALAFDAARWPAYAAGTRRHGVRIDMHELSGNGRDGAKASASRRVPSGVSVESLYRTVFIDRLQAVLGRTAERHRTGTDAHAAEHAIAIDMDRPHNGHLPNLRLLLRWRDPTATPLRFAAAEAEGEAGSSAASREALRRWLARQGDERVASELHRERLDWSADSAVQRFTDDNADALMALGHAALWRAVDPAVQWIAPAVAVCFEGGWYELPVVLHDSPGEDGAVERTWWLLRESEPLPAGLDAASLLQAARSAQAVQCVGHQAGLGAFVMLAIDVDAWRRTRGA